MLKRSRFRPLYLALALLAVVCFIAFFNSTRTKIPTVEEINSEKELFITNKNRPCTTGSHTNYVKPPSYAMKIGTNNWLTKDLESRIQSAEFGNCPTCNMNKFNKNGTSTQRDFIITSMMNCSNNVQTFMRSLRSTGCSAIVIIFCDNLAIKKLSGYQQVLLTNCGAVLINIGYMDKKYVKNPFENRHPLFYTFLYHYKHLMDRVIIMDLLDSVFQEDPFSSAFTSTTMAATTEMLKFSQCEINTDWVSKADPNYAKDFYENRTPLCFGMVYGGINCILKFYDIMFRRPEWSKFQVKTIDQGYLSYYFYKGVFSSQGLILSGTKVGDKIISTRGGKVSKDNGPAGEFLMEGSDVVPAVIHHYNRHCKIWQEIQTLCPEIGHDDVAYAKQKEMKEKCPPPK
ncbi:hypothetical protein TVAG_204870 [Trichomonas vaginalis G3]|uniref:Nucleotide-diphospho-sugar transferase domain-containing protein n=2 Tax=Trichomonas vaginalis (strain ATCC PRA-98 / G3) TaxID=412133 RepID=A2EIZ0_TRIV3|nr:hypothetical protein TVAG_204870 [Trichomonas vaginalis G3]|eukprot:XP_001319603.1 hypothetical protein [Trichomonas vaginalis G3]